MNHTSIARILRNVGVEVEERSVSSEAFNLPSGARIREFANLDGFSLSIASRVARAPSRLPTLREPWRGREQMPWRS